MDALSQLLDIEAIRQLKARYFYYVDSKDWDAWLDLFTPDAAFEWDNAVATLGRDGETSQKYVGREGLAEIPKIVADARTVHMGHTPIIEILSETEARAIWPMEDIVERAQQDRRGWGHYHETYRKIDGRWLIRSLHLRRQRLVIASR